MNDLTEQLRRYAEAVDPDAVATHDAEDYALVSTPRPKARLALVACLALTIGVASALLVARTGNDADAPVSSDAAVSTSATTTNDELEMTLEVDDTELALGDALTAKLTITNISDTTLRIRNPSHNTASLQWAGPSAPNDQAQGLLDAIRAPYSQLSLTDVALVPPTDPATGAPSTTDLPGPVDVAPGETLTVDYRTLLGDEVATGDVVLVAETTTMPDQNPGELLDRRSELEVRIPVTIEAAPGAPPTRPDAVAVVLAYPDIQTWLEQTAGSAVAGGSGLKPVDDGWRLMFGSTAGQAEDPMEEALRAAGGPGFIATVDDTGAVTVDWIAGPQQ